MEAKTQNLEKKLSLTRILPFSLETVFKAWTDPEELKLWFCPEGFTTSAARVDLQVGGEYRITIKSPDGKIIDHFGVYREILPNEKLVFTWIIGGQECAGSEGASAETLVTVEFGNKGDSTELSLIHEGFPDDKSRDGHEFGWNSCLDHFAKVYGT